MKTGKITVQFADRCKEYQDAKIKLRPTTMVTERFFFGAFFVTTQYLNSEFETYKIILS